MSERTATFVALTLGLAACGGLGNPGDSDAASNPFTSTTAVPPWMGSETAAPTTTGGTDGASGAPTTSGMTGSASMAPGGPATTSTGEPATDGGTGTSTGTGGEGTTTTGEESGAPKLDLPPAMSTGDDEDKDKDKDVDRP